MERIELLAPAKDLETGQAAINSGADAVYIGATRFGAREAAGNSLGDIETLISYAHKYWARVYVTVNTLLYDEELAQAEHLVHALYQVGADALIIQDVGLLELDLPPLPLFASTQMHNHTPERVAFLEKVGFQRVILARELNLEQIRAIRASTQVELETFIHGALCVSYSGQCYMSYALGGRSGNRGQCAQPCRRPYKLVDRNGEVLENGRYLLSLKDLNLTDELPNLLDAGVTSFKIEGRLKDKAYVMNVVAHYRQQLDGLLEGKNAKAAASGKVQFDFTPNPLKTFNRGTTEYFLHGRKAPVGSPDTPKALGEPVGQVARVEKNAFILEGGAVNQPAANNQPAAEIHRGDGLCFFNPQRELVGAIVNDVQPVTQKRGPQLQRILLDKMEGLVPGIIIYRNHDRLFLAQLDKSQVCRKISVRFRLAETRNGLALFAQDEDGNEAMQIIEIEKVPAEKPEQALANIEKQLNKLGGTEFECSFVRIDLSEALFIPLGALNGLRRAALEDLARQRLTNYPRPVGGGIKNEAPFPQKELSYLGNVLNQKARDFYHRHGVTNIEPAAESGLTMRGRKVMTTRHCIKHQLGYCARYHKPAANGVAVGTVRLQEPLALIDEQGNRYPLRFNCAQCEMEVYFHSCDPQES